MYLPTHHKGSVCEDCLEGVPVIHPARKSIFMWILFVQIVTIAFDAIFVVKPMYSTSFWLLFMRLAQILFSFRGLAGTWRSNWDISLNLNERNIIYSEYSAIANKRPKKWFLGNFPK